MALIASGTSGGREGSVVQEVLHTDSLVHTCANTAQRRDNLFRPANYAMGSTDAAPTASWKLIAFATPIPPDARPPATPTGQYVVPPAESLQKRVPGVVSTRETLSIVLSLHLPKGTTNVVVPAELVPEQLAQYGKPVWVSLDMADGYRRLVIEARTIEGDTVNEELSALEGWVNSLK